MKPALRVFLASFLTIGLSGGLLGGALGCKTESSKEELGVDQIDIRVGGGQDAEPGKTLTVHYTGWLHDPSKPDKKGRVFDSSVGKAPFSFVLGQGQVIPGWEKGVEGMKEGGLRRLVVPPSLAYGSTGAGDVIPPDAVLVFEVELIRVR